MHYHYRRCALLLNHAKFGQCDDSPSNGYRKSPRTLIVLLILPWLLTGPAFSQDLIEPTTHWKYASFFDTGWYKINDERSAFILRVAPRWTFGEAGIDDQGKREIAYTLRVPMTLGLAKLEFEDIPGILDPGNLTTASLNFSADADILVTTRLSLRPSAEVGYGRVVGMYDPIGHFVYLKSHGGFSYESGRKRNTAQATSSRTRG